jgi:hypothetical protein
LCVFVCFVRLRVSAPAKPLFLKTASCTSNCADDACLTVDLLYADNTLRR